MYGSGVESPKVPFSSVDYTVIAPGSYFIGFDMDNAGKLSKMDNTGTITVIEVTSSVIDVGSGPGSTVRICNSNTASGDCSTVSGGR